MTRYAGRTTISLVLLFLCCFSVASCASSPSAVPQGKPLEYFQTYNFASSPELVQKAFHKILEAKKYEILKEDPLQITAVNAEVTSVEILTYARHHAKMAQSVYSGEIRLTIDLLEDVNKGTLVSVKSLLKAVVGRPANLHNDTWAGKEMIFESRGDIENEMLMDVARELKEKEALAILVTRDIELEGGFTLQYV